jgi:hypothetical protein
MAERIAINSASKLSEDISLITRMYREKKYLVLSLREGRAQ